MPKKCTNKFSMLIIKNRKKLLTTIKNLIIRNKEMQLIDHAPIN